MHNNHFGVHSDISVITRACDSSLVLMISFCTGVDNMARYQLLNNNNNNNNNRTTL